MPAPLASPCTDHSPAPRRQPYCEETDCPNRADSIVEGLCDLHFAEWAEAQRRLDAALPEPTPERVARLAGGFALCLAAVLSLLFV